MRAEVYSRLDPWKKTQIARHTERPHFLDYVAGLIDDFVELRGDRKFADDQALLGGLGRFRGRAVLVMGQEKGHDTETRIKHNFGMARPEGYRKAVRLMDLAEQFGLPVLSFIDTGGAYPGIDGEERGVAEAIARGTERCITLGVPMIAVITSEDTLSRWRHRDRRRQPSPDRRSYARSMPVISPEGCASICSRDLRKLAEETARV